MVKKAKKLAVTDEYGTGRFLCVSNNTPGILSLPDTSDKTGLSDVTLQAWDTEVVSEEFLDIPHFLRRIEDGSITVFRSDTVPPKRDWEVPADIRLDDKILNAQSLRIVSSPNFNKVAISLVNIGKPQPNGDESTVDSNWLKTMGVKFLKNIAYREEKFRQRAEVLQAVNQRLLDIKAL